MGARLLSIAVSAFVASALAACSSLPDVHFDEVDGAAGDGGVVVAQCTCQVPPAGWTPVNFVATSRPSCPAGETAIDLRVANGDGTPTCSCTCGGVGGTCTTGNFNLAVTAEATCGVAPKTASIPVSEAACTALGSSIAVPTGAFAKAIAVPPTSCAPKAAITSSLTNGRLCEPPRSPSCNAGQFCAPTASIGLTSCVARAGANACPPEFPKRSTTGTGTDQSQACVGCACAAPSACAGGTVSLFDGSMCKTNGGSQGAVNIGSACAATSDANFTATHFKSTPPTGGCASAPTKPATPGTLSFTDMRTVCCK